MAAVGCLGLVGGGAGDAGGLDIDVADERFRGIVGLADAVGAEGVGGDDIGARVEIGARHLADDLGAGEREDVVVALLVAREVKRAAIGGFVQPAALDLGAEGAVDDEDPAGGGLGQTFACGHAASSLMQALGLRPSRWQIA